VVLAEALFALGLKTGESREAVYLKQESSGTAGVAAIAIAAADRSSLLHQKGENSIRFIVREQLISRLLRKRLKILYRTGSVAKTPNTSPSSAPPKPSWRADRNGQLSRARPDPC